MLPQCAVVFPVFVCACVCVCVRNVARFTIIIISTGNEPEPA